MNNLCRQNGDFETFLSDVLRDFSGKKIHASEYDKVEEKIEEYIKDRLMTWEPSKRLAAQLCQPCRS